MRCTMSFKEGFYDTIRDDLKWVPYFCQELMKPLLFFSGLSFDLQGTNMSIIYISHLGKRKIIFNSALVGDMLHVSSQKVGH